MPDYVVRQSVLIGGDLTVDGNIIVVRHRRSAAHVEHDRLVPLSDLVGTAPVFPGSLRVPGNLVIPSYDTGSGGRCTFAVRGSILAMSEVFLDG